MHDFSNSVGTASLRHTDTDDPLDVATIRPSDYAAAVLVVVFAMYVRYMLRKFITGDFINARVSGMRRSRNMALSLPERRWRTADIGRLT